jgi:hypothetical protein
MFETELRQSVIETGEQMLFQDFAVEPIPDSAQYFWAKIEVSSPARFDLVIGAADGHARMIARILYGDDSISESDGSVSDLISELANTIAGTLARSLSDDAPVALSTPIANRGALPCPLATCVGFKSSDLELVAAVLEHAA